MTKNQTIYTILRGAGLTEAATFGLMGNWDCESNLEPGRLQEDFSAFRTSSRNYVVRVTSGALDKESFAEDKKGFGLAQWTLAYRKQKLYDFWKSSGLALDSEVMQTKFALNELTTEGEYVGLLKLLKTSNNLSACVESVCRNYERPAVNNIDARYSAAVRLQASMSGFSAGGDIEIYPIDESPETATGDATAANQEQTPAIMPTHEYWPPRVLCEGMKGPDVEALCALLKAQDYGVNYVDSTFTSFLKERVKAFQEDKGLKADGIAGPLTWSALLKVTSW